MSDITQYIRNRAATLRARAKQGMNEEAQADYTSGARHLEIVADEIDNEFHVNEDED